MNTKKDNFYIITGGPGVGKTTLINSLQNNGFQIVQEDARRIIKNQIEINGDGLPWKNKALYAKLMLDASINSYEKMLDKNDADIIFFDRGIIDALCYMRMEKIPISRETDEILKQYRYNKKVFILPPWKEIYETDNERKQNWYEAELTYEKMKETYSVSGYNIIIVPKTSTEERVQFVLQNIEKI